MSRPSHDPPHKYTKRDIAAVPGKRFYVQACAYPGCSHYLLPKVAIGKESICWYCDESFTMNARSISLKRPHCVTCNSRGSTRTIDKDKVADLIKQLELEDA